MECLFVLFWGVGDGGWIFDVLVGGYWVVWLDWVDFVSGVVVDGKDEIYDGCIGGGEFVYVF